MTVNRVRCLFCLTIILLTGALSAEIVAPVVAVSAAVNTDSAATAARNNRIVFKADSEWKVVDMSDIQVKKGSALDLTAISENGPAGRHGRLTVSTSGELVFEDSPAVPRRFFAYNGFFSTFKFLDDPDKNVVQERFAKLAELIKRQGYDLVRPLALDGYIMKGSTKDCEFNPDKLDNIDRLFAELKANGVYIYLDIAAYRVGIGDGKKAWNERNDEKLMMFLGDPGTRTRWQTLAGKMLNHVNPYTKTAWKDEPAIVCVNFYNEQEIIRYREFSKYLPQTRELLNRCWRDWLQKKYQTPASLAKAWGRQNVAAFDKIELPGSRNGSKPEANDYGLFFYELISTQMAWCENIVRSTGYKGLTSGIDMSYEAIDNAIRWEYSDVAGSHSYFAHPSDAGQNAAKMTQASSIGQTAGYWRSANSTRLADRPILQTEYNHFFWNQYQHENGLVFPAYSAFQGFSALFLHEDAVALEVSNTEYVDLIARNPVNRANEFISACLFKRGDVRKTAHQVQMQISSAYLKSNNNGVKAVSSEQNKIGLMTGFSLTFPDIKRPSTLKSVIPRPDLAILPESGAEIAGGEWAASVIESKNTPFSLQKFVSDLKTKGILPASNLSDPDAGVFQNETGEITMRSKENLIKVITPKTEGVSLEANKAETLSLLRVESSTVPAAVAVCAIDNQPLTSSSRMVLIYNTEIAFTGMELSGDRTIKFKPGKFPLLLRAGKLNAALKCRNAAKMALYALRIDGTRRDKLPVTADGDVLKITIDTAALKNGNTTFFELVAE